VLNNFFLKSQSDADLLDSQALESHPSVHSITALNPPQFTFRFTDDKTTSLCFRLLKSKNSAGLDGISSKLLKACAPALISPITDLFNFWIWNGHLPQELKKSVIVPVHKKGDSEVVCNYRPISLLLSISKLFELTLLQQLEKHFNEFLPTDMFSFLKNVGCEHALVELTERCRKDMDEKKRPLLLALDLSKAFDMIDYQLLLRKLQAYGMDTSSLNLMRSYLRQRVQCTKVNDSISSEKQVK
jgi:hypothetical protein